MVTKSSMEKMRELDFIRQVLMPWMKGMGYEDVQFWHGNDEGGKDVVGWRINPELGTLECLAMVAKATALSGTNQISDIRGQVDQAFHEPFRLSHNQSPMLADRVLVVTNKSLPTQRKKNIIGRIKSDRAVELLDRDMVWAKARAYVKSTLYENLEEAQSALTTSRGQFKYQASLSQEKITVQVMPTQPGQVATGKVTFGASNEPDSERIWAEYQRFLEEGGEFSLSEVDGVIVRIETDEPEIEGILPIPEEFSSFRMTQLVDTSRYLLVDVIATSTDGETAVLRGIELTEEKSGSRSVTLGNSHQDHYAKMTLTSSDDNRTLYTFKKSGDDIFATELHSLVKFARIIGGNHELQLVDTRTGIDIHTHCTVLKAEQNEPSLIESVSAVLCEVEKRTSAKFQIPLREFTKEELEALELLHTVVFRSTEVNTLTSLNVGLDGTADELSEFIDIFSGPEPTPVRELVDVVVQVFGTTLELGRRQTLVHLGRPSNYEELITARESVGSGENIRISAHWDVGADDKVETTYIDWIDGRPLNPPSSVAASGFWRSRDSKPEATER